MTVEGGEGQRQLGNGDPVEIWAIGTGTGDWDWTWPRSTVTVTECQRALTSGQATAVQRSAGLSRDTSSTARLRWLNPQPCPIQPNPTCLSNSQPSSSVVVQALASPCSTLPRSALLCTAARHRWFSWRCPVGLRRREEIRRRLHSRGAQTGDDFQN